MCVHKLIWYTCMCEIMQLRVCHVLLLIRINLQRSVVFEYVLYFARGLVFFAFGVSVLCTVRLF